MAAAGPDSTVAHLPPVQGNPSGTHPVQKRTTALALGALGVVFGDIGTSPLYTIRECFNGPHAVALDEINIFGVVSLIFWSLTMVVTVKYVAFILRADNRSEGGIFALLGLILGSTAQISPRLRAAIVLGAIFGAALLYGDGIITPAISVLSAIEGLEVATRAAKPAVVPLTCAVLVGLFLIQHRGTADIGKVFGAIMILWFGAIAASGLGAIAQTPKILLAVNPVYAWNFFAANHLHGAVALGSVVLCITGGEALYADLGHFGRRAIRVSWLGLAFPALLLNYFGQAALLIDHPELNFHPFYGLVPSGLLYPMVALSTIATVIASQALISGVFSLTQQAIQLGLCPRVHIVHTSADVRGQIFIPGVNFALMLACIGLVLSFKESSGLAGAYGIAVTATMSLTSGLYLAATIKVWRWPLWKALPLVVVFLLFDLAYFGANLLKIFDGGWITLVVAFAIITTMTTWRKGREELKRKLFANRVPLDVFLSDIERQALSRVRGTAVFMTLSPEGAPPTLLHHVKHNHMLHEHVVLLTLQSADAPVVANEDRMRIERLKQGFYRLTAWYGYMETPSVPRLMKSAAVFGLPLEPTRTTFYLGRETLLTTGKSKMARWRKSLFAFMSRNAANPAVFFGIPPNRVVELGAQVQL
ncbi:MAG: potassium transporter Kup [Deltaproteobacteria bacterium]|nr:potassium transporter Kup [Deltaproteobacteria bacterium]